jgi:putative ABC transport system permease protein
MSALRHKSWRDLRRRPTRSAFTIATIAFAVAGLWIFAMPVLMKDAMNQRIAQDRLADVRLSTTDVVLGAGDMAALRAVPGVTALDARTLYQTKIATSRGHRDVLIAGVSDWANQPVNAVAVDSGKIPQGTEVVTDPMNGRTGRYSGGVGDTVNLEDTTGQPRAFTVAGRGDTLALSQLVAQQHAVLYAPQATVNTLADARGVNSIEFRVRDPRRASDVAAAVRSRLLELHPAVTFPELVNVRPAGEWPGEDVFNKFATLLYVGAVLALVSALVLISNTMTTTVAEQRREIAIMKAIGGRRRQIRWSFLRTALVLGVIGTVLGIALGIPFANGVLGFIGNRFFGITPSWGVPANALIISVVVGVGATLLAALPALRRAARSSVLDDLQASSTTGKTGWLDRALRRARLPRTTQIGLRNVARRRTRTYATVLQITLAASVALGFLALGVTVATETAKTWDAMSWDIIVSQRGNVPLDSTAARLITTTSGVARAQPILYNTLKVGDRQYESWGIPPDTTLYKPKIVAGRWLRPSDDSVQPNVVVIGRALANTIGAQVGDTITVGTARGNAQLQVVGVDSNLMNNSTTLFLPLSRFQALLGRSDTNAYWVVATDQQKPSIDSLATAEEERLTTAGYPVSTQIRYVERAANLESNRVLVGVLAAIGIPIVIIGMIGLLNAMTMNVIERTREIGILRCIGAPARAVRRVFRAEALTVAFAGAVIAIPGGWLIGALLCWIVTNLFHYGSVPYAFPVVAAGLAVLATLAIAWLVVVAPVHRASNLQPGDALRYE